jgi:hypothetical protein
MRGEWASSTFYVYIFCIHTQSTLQYSTSVQYFNRVTQRIIIEQHLIAQTGTNKAEMNQREMRSSLVSGVLQLRELSCVCFLFCVLI